MIKRVNIHTNRLSANTDHSLFHFRYLAFLLCIPAMIGTLWDAPCRSICVGVHGASKYGIAVAGIASIQNLMQAFGAKVILSFNQAVAGTKPENGWMSYLACSVMVLFALGISFTFPAKALDKAYVDMGFRKRAHTLHPVPSQDDSSSRTVGSVPGGSPAVRRTLPRLVQVCYHYCDSLT